MRRYYRRGDERVTVRPNPPALRERYGPVDEVWGEGVTVHLEQLDEHTIWADIGGLRCVWHSRGRITLSVEPDSCEEVEGEFDERSAGVRR